MHSKEENALLEKDDNLAESMECSTALKVTVAAAQGGRKYMEDRVHIEVVRDLYGKLEHVFLAVYDGHGGTQASDYVREHLHENITSNIKFHSTQDEDVLSVIRQGFLKTHQNMHKAVDDWPMTLSGYPCTAGTTASCAIFREGKLYTGHVGDSAIVLGSSQNGSMIAVKLTEDHKPDDVVEKKRIESAGGGVGIKAGVSRVIWKRPSKSHKGPIRRSTPTENIPFLAVARALGDFWSLNEDNNEFVVSPEPDVSVTTLKKSDRWIVLASDGMTNVLPAQRVISLLNDLDSDGVSNSVCNFKARDENLEPNHAQFILQAAFSRWGNLRADNISVICVKLDDVSLPVGHPSIQVEDPFLKVNTELTSYPASMIRATSTSTMRLQTNPVRVVYQGNNGFLDRSIAQLYRLQSNHSAVSLKNDDRIFSGPGFILPENDQTEDDRGSDEEAYEDSSEAIGDSKVHPSYSFRLSILERAGLFDPATTGPAAEMNGSSTADSDNLEGGEREERKEEQDGDAQEMENSTVPVNRKRSSFGTTVPIWRTSTSLRSAVLDMDFTQSAGSDNFSIGLPTRFFVDAALTGTSLPSPVAMLESIRSSSSAAYRPTLNLPAPRGTNAQLPHKNGAAVRSSLFSKPSSFLWSPMSVFRRRPQEDVYTFRGNEAEEELGLGHSSGSAAITSRKRMYSSDLSTAEKGGEIASAPVERPCKKRKNDDEDAEESSTTVAEPEAKNSRGKIWDFISKYFPKSS